MARKGRPAGPPTTTYAVRITDSVRDMLQRAAHSKNIPMANYMRNACESSARDTLNSTPENIDILRDVARTMVSELSDEQRNILQQGIEHSPGGLAQALRLELNKESTSFTINV